MMILTSFKMKTIGLLSISLALSIAQLSVSGCSNETTFSRTAEKNRSQGEIEANNSSEVLQGTLKLREKQTEPFDDLFDDGALIDSSKAWLSGLEVKRTYDGGNTWHELVLVDANAVVPRGYSDVYKQIFFLNGVRGWLIVGGGTWQTEDGGATFRLQFKYGSDMPAFYGNHGWINVGLNDLFDEKAEYQNFITNDAGRTWQPCATTPLSFYLSGIHSFINENMGWAVIFPKEKGEKSVPGIAMTDDGGCSWKLVWKGDENSDESYKSIFFLNEKEGWLGGYQNGSLLHTVDGGKKWKPMQLPEKTTRVWSIHFANSQEGWILAKPFAYDDTAGILKTVNGGKSWEAAGLEDIPVEWSRGKLYRFLVRSTIKE